MPTFFPKIIEVNRRQKVGFILLFLPHKNGGRGGGWPSDLQGITETAIERKGFWINVSINIYIYIFIGRERDDL